MRREMKKRMTAGIMGAAVLVLASAGASSASAAEASAPAVPTAAEPAVGPAASLSAEDTALLETLLSATDSSSGVFDAERALAAGASPSDVADYATAYQAAGKSVEGIPVSVKAQTSEAGERVAAAASRCTGDRGYTGFWGWGWQWALNSCDTDLLSAALVAGGGGVAAVGGIISAAGVTAPAGAVTAAAGGLVAAGGPIIQVCKAASYEKQAIYLNAFVSGNVGCWGQ